MFAVKSEDNRRFFIMGHPEYDPETLNLEYSSETSTPEKKSPSLPTISQTMTPPSRRWCTWRSAGQLLYNNWLNYYVYQATPYDLRNVGKEAPKISTSFLNK